MKGRKRDIPDLDLDVYTDIPPQEFEIEGNRFSVKFENDDYWDFSEYGEYTNKPNWYNGTLVIDRKANHDQGYHELQYFQCAVDLEGERKALSKFGYSKHDSWLLPRQWSFDAYNRMESYNKGHWCYIGITVTHLDTGNCDSVWGVESDAPKLYINEYVYDLAQGLIPQTLKEVYHTELVELV